MSEPMAPPPPPFPVAPAPKSSNAMKWVLGCGLGCLVVIVIVVAGIAGFGYWAVRSAAPKFIQTTYQQLKTEKKVPVENQATYDRIVELGTGSKSSMYAKTLVTGLVFSTFADGAVSPEELSAANDLLALLEANPNISAVQLQEFQTKHPEFSNAQPGAFGVPMSPAQPPEPPKVPEEVAPPAPETPAAPVTEGGTPAAPPTEGGAPTQPGAK